MEAFKRKRVPPEALEIILSSITKSTLNQYTPPLREWWFFCRKKKVDFYSASVQVLLEFFSLYFEEGKLYGSLNSARSALSLILGSEVTGDPIIKRFFKGVLNLRPSHPKYNTIWDPEMVISYLETLFPNDRLSLRELSFKTVTLLALETAQRAQTLSFIKLENIQTTEKGFIIKIPDRIKTSGLNRFQPLLNITKNDNNKRCPFKTLQVYLDRTSVIRGNIPSLFITFVRPYHAATSQTLSRWIKQILRLSGIDTSVYSAHSTRHASTSAAFRKGVPLEVIKDTASWSVGSTSFFKFYNKPLNYDKKCFSQAVLGP